jgi:hypothetical protein
MLCREQAVAVGGGRFKDLNAGYKNHDGRFDSFTTLLTAMCG